MLTASSTNLEIVFRGDFLELSLVGGQLWHLNMHRRTDSRAKIGWAESEETEPVVMRERQALLDVVDGGYKTPVDGPKITTHLHGDDTEMVLLVAPDQERFGIVMEDATATGPETASVGGLQEAITFLEQEVIVDQFLLDVLAHAGKGVESSLEFS